MPLNEEYDQYVGAFKMNKIRIEEVKFMKNWAVHPGPFAFHDMIPSPIVAPKRPRNPIQCAITPTEKRRINFRRTALSAKISICLHYVG